MFWTLLELHFSGLKSILFYPESKKCFFPFFFARKQHMIKGRFFDKNHGLTPLQNVDFFRLFQIFTFEVQKALFSIQNIKKCFFLPFFGKKKTYKKKVDFLTKTMD